MFTSQYEIGRRAQRDGHWQCASEAYADALAQWSGPALMDVRYTPELDAAARSLDSLRLSAYERRAAVELYLGRHVDLIGELYSLSARNPVWESIHSHLIVALYRAGQPIEALRVYTRLRGMLADEYGIEPSSGLDTLQQMVLARDKRLDHPAPPTAADHLGRSAAVV